jgi:Family of unknown function (DUF6714)
MLPEHATILEQLRAAFPAEPIDAARAFDDWGMTYPDAEPYAQHLEGKTWEQLDRSYIITRADALGFLGTRELVAVLPVYLRALLEDGAWSPAADTVVLVLTKPDPGKKTGIKLPRFEALVSALTSAQRAAVATVLHVFVASNEEGSPGERARAALECHWNAYQPGGS